MSKAWAAVAGAAAIGAALSFGFVYGALATILSEDTTEEV